MESLRGTVRIGIDEPLNFGEKGINSRTVLFRGIRHAVLGGSWTVAQLKSESLLGLIMNL